MKDPVFRDTLIAFCILGVVAAVFMFGVYLPGRSRMEAIEMQTAAAEQSLRDIPIRVAELEMLDADLNERLDYLKKTADLVPSVPDTHATIRDVAELAANCSLKVARLEPLSPVRLETIEALPYRISLEGSRAG
jgi:Tfp pilus assembly protein PilO